MGRSCFDDEEGRWGVGSLLEIRRGGDGEVEAGGV